MLMLFKLLVVIGFVVYKYRGDLSKLKADYQKALDTAVTLAQVNPTSPCTRRAAMESEFGTPWDTWNPDAYPDLEFDRPATTFGHLRRYFGPMDMEVAGDKVLIYDMQLGNNFELSDGTKFPFQTVISIKPPELHLPPFVLRPKSICSDGALQDRLIQTGTLLDKIFTVESLAPHRVEALFQSELGNRVLIPFLIAHPWIVQWTGKCLNVYEFNRLIEPERLAEVALEVSELFELLKSGPAVIDQGINDLIQETINRTNTHSEIGLKRHVR